MSGSTPNKVPYHPDYVAFRASREKYAPYFRGITDTVVNRVCDLVENHGGGHWSSFQHKTTGEKLLILYLDTPTPDLKNAPREIGGFKIIPGDHRHAALG